MNKLVGNKYHGIFAISTIRSSYLWKINKDPKNPVEFDLQRYFVFMCSHGYILSFLRVINWCINRFRTCSNRFRKMGLAIRDTQLEKVWVTKISILCELHWGVFHWICFNTHSCMYSFRIYITNSSSIKKIHLKPRNSNSSSYVSMERTYIINIVL